MMIHCQSILSRANRAKTLRWEQVWSSQGTASRSERREGYEITLKQRLVTDNRECYRPKVDAGFYSLSL